MNKLIKQVTYMAGITVALLAMACSDDIAEEITTLETSRLFSPTNLTIDIRNQTSALIRWKAVEKAQSYNIEVYANPSQDYGGSPLRTASTESLTHTFTKFDGQTTYSLRIQAVGDGIAESKWTSTTFTTSPEQIFYSVDDNDILGTQATLRWPAGEVATHITVTPGNLTYTVTSADIAAGVATLTELDYDTKYTALLMNGEKIRGTLEFTTRPDGIPVTTEDNLAELIATSVEGDKFLMKSGVHVIDADITVAHSITIKGEDPTDVPVLKGVIFRVKENAGLQLGGLVLDGTDSKDGNQAIIYDEDGSNPPLVIENCEIKNYTKGTLYVNKKTKIESVTIKGCIYSNIECNGGDFIDFRNGIAGTFEFTNNTAYNSALARDFFRMDAGGSTNFPEVKSLIKIANNTFNNVSNGNNRRMLYIRLASHEITFNKNILANTEGYYSNQAATTITEMSNNNYHNAPNFTGSTQSNAKNDTGTYTSLNPGFKNAGEGDFTLTDETLIENGIGDPRWW